MGSSHRGTQVSQVEEGHSQGEHSMFSATEPWQDYRLEPASWINSLLVHIMALTVLIVPFVLRPKLGQ